MLGLLAIKLGFAAPHLLHKKSSTGHRKERKGVLPSCSHRRAVPGTAADALVRIHEFEAEPNFWYN
jgi:hypothetical protein